RRAAAPTFSHACWASRSASRKDQPSSSRTVRVAASIAYEAVARAAPDGNTLVINANSFVINPHLRKVNYDPLTSYEPICYLLSSPQVIVVKSDAPYRTLAEFITDAHAKPGQLTFATVGPATTQHIGFEQFKRVANVNVIYVPYPGGAPAMSALL